MISKDILYSKGKNDECYTPSYGVSPILKYIPNNTIVWCPFDTEKSEFVKQISKLGKGIKVIYSHISRGEDFFNYEPNEKWDMIISNPPFTGKRNIFERALSFNKPFALIMSNTWLNDSAPKQLFKEKDLQLLMFDKRMKFILGGKDTNMIENKFGDIIDYDNSKITFSSSYYCYNFLPKQIVMEELIIDTKTNKAS